MSTLIREFLAVLSTLPIDLLTYLYIKVAAYRDIKMASMNRPKIATHVINEDVVIDTPGKRIEYNKRN